MEKLGEKHTIIWVKSLFLVFHVTQRQVINATEEQFCITDVCKTIKLLLDACLMQYIFIAKYQKPNTCLSWWPKSLRKSLKSSYQANLLSDNCIARLLKIVRHCWYQIALDQFQFAKYPLLATVNSKLPLWTLLFVFSLKVNFLDANCRVTSRSLCKSALFLSISDYNSLCSWWLTPLAVITEHCRFFHFT